MQESDFKIRNAQASDHPRIMAVMPEWWGGRDLTSLLPVLFLEHFCDTSFVIEKGSELVGFLVGFMSQAHLDEAYIHFVGVHPDYRKEGVGAFLYKQFFKICRERDRSIVRAITSPVNTGSVAFHTRLGFQVEHGESKILFTKCLET